MARWGVLALLALAGTASAQRRPPFAPPTVQQLVENLRTGTELQRREAASSLVLSNPADHPLVVPALVGVLKDPDGELRVKAAASLWQLNRHPLVISTLIGACKGERDEVRLLALDVLRDIGPAARSVVPRLADMLEENNLLVRRKVVETLVRCVIPARRAGSLLEESIEQKVVLALVKMLQEGDALLRGESATALGAIGPGAKAAVAELEPLLQAPEARVRIAAADALWLIEQHPRSQSVLIEAFADASDTARRSALDALGWWGPAARRAVPEIRKLLIDPHYRVRGGALLALRCIGEWDNRTLAAVAAMSRRDSRADLRAAALRTLALLGERARPVKAQLRAALEDEYRSVRVAAAEALWQVAADPNALLAMIEHVGVNHQTLTVDSNPDAGSPLLRLGPEALPALKAIENRISPTAEIAYLKARILAGRNDVKLLVRSLEDDRPEVCVEAARALGQLGPGAAVAVTALASRLQDENKLLRQAVLSALGRVGPGAAAALPKLRELLNDPNAETRHLAAEALALIGGPDALATLIPLLGDKDSVLRRFAALGLRQSGAAGKPAIAMLEAALKEQDPLLRAWAAEALWSVAQHPDSVPALLALIKERSAGPERYAAVRSLAAIAPPHEVLLPALIAALDDEATREEAAIQLKGLGTKARSAVPALLRAARAAPPGKGTVLIEAVLRLDPDNVEIIPLLIERDFEGGLEELARRGPRAESAIPALQRYIRDHNSHGKGFAAVSPVLQRIAPRLFVPPPWQDPERLPSESSPEPERDSESEQSHWLIVLLGGAVLGGFCCSLVFRRPRQKDSTHALSNPT